MAKKILASVKNFIRTADIFILVLGIVSCVIGIIFIASATRSYKTNSYVTVQIAAAIIGICLFILFTIIEADILTEKWGLLLVFNILMICALYVFGYESGGNKGWIDLGAFSIQPAEIVKISYILLNAKLISWLKNDRDINHFTSILMIFLHFALMFVLIISASSDMGSALVYLFIFVVMLLAGEVKLRWFLIGIGAAALFLPIFWLYILRADQKERILAPFDSTIDPEGLGVNWQSKQSKLAIANGGTTGMGLFNGKISQGDLLPAKQTDFIFSVIGEEMGMLGCILVIALLTAIIARCIYVGFKANTTFDLAICFGVAGMFTFQMLENIGMCLGILPVIGLTLPFFSYGGSSIVVSFAGIGLVSGVHARRRPSTYYSKF